VRPALPLLILIAWLATACGGGDSSGTPAPVATVTVTPNPAIAAAGSTTLLLEDDETVLIGGGQDASGDVVASAEIYDPGSGHLHAGGRHAAARRTEQAAAYIGQ
jgi:hypothetical protein